MLVAIEIFVDFLILQKEKKYVKNDASQYYYFYYIWNISNEVKIDLHYRGEYLEQSQRPSYSVTIIITSFASFKLGPSVLS